MVSQANLLLSCKSFAQLIASAMLLPITDSFVLNTLRVPAKVKDLRLARMSISLVMVGFAVLVLAPSVWVVIVGKKPRNPMSRIPVRHTSEELTRRRFVPQC